MSNQLQLTGGAKVRDLQDVIIGTSGVLSSLAFNVANGVPKLDVNGKILVSQLPNSVMEYKGVWNAAANSPTLTNGGAFNEGDVYLCNVAGTVNFGAGPISFIVGDQAIYSGSVWQKAGGATGTVTSVGLSTNAGAITIGNSPISTSGTITANFNGTNLQYVNGAGNLTTFPDLSVYVTLAGTQTITGSKTFSSTALFDTSTLFKKVGSPYITSAGYTSLQFTASGTNTSLYITDGDSVTSNRLIFKNNAGYDYTFPAASGTIALTSDIPILTGYVPYTGATANVDLGTFNLTADVITGATGSFTSNGGSDTFAINHSSGAGIALNITKGGNGEGLYINKTSGSGNAATIIGTLNATTLVKSGGTSSQFLKADGTVDSSTYALDSAVVHLAGTETITGAKTFTAALVGATSTFTNAGSGIGVGITLSGASGDGLKVTHSAGRALNIASSGAGYGIIINNDTASTSIPFTIQKSGSNVITMSDTGAANFTGQLTLGSTITNGASTYTLPSSSGTLALTSALSAYLPLAGGTLTGPLGGTSAIFSGASYPIVQVVASATFPILSLNNSGQSSQWNIEVGRTTSGNLEFYNSGTKLSLTSLGNLGLGVTPSAWSQITAIELSNGVSFGAYSGAAAPNMYATSNAYYNGTNWIYKLSSYAPTLYVQNSLGNYVWNTAPSGTGTITFTQAMTLFSDGNLLLTNGTVSNAGYKLDVNGTGRFSSTVQGASFYVPSTVFTPSVPAYQTLVKYGQTNTFAEIQGGNLNLDNFSTYLRFIVNGTASNTPLVALTLANTGAATFSSSVGVGGTATNRLTVLGAETGTQITTIPIGKFVNTGNSFSKLVLGSDNANFDAVVSMDNNATLANCKLRFYIGNGTGSTAGHSNDQLVLTGGGNVLIGTTTNNTGLLQVNGTIYATGFYESSDIRFKNIIETNPNVNVLGIDVIKFTRKDNDTNQVRYGYSAQQVQSILPDAVTGTDFLNVNYLDVHTLKIAQLEQEIKELKAKMN
jgi:hypothetical protein